MCLEECTGDETIVEPCALWGEWLNTKLEEAPAIIRSTGQICTEVPKNRPLKIIRPFRSKDITKYLPS